MGLKASVQKLKVHTKESDKSKARKGSCQKRGLKEKFVLMVDGAVCLSQQFVCLLFVPGEVSKDKERTEL